MIEVLAYYGFKARAVSTSLAIYNAAMLRLLDSGVEIPDDHDERVALFNQTGAWGVGVVGPDSLPYFRREQREAVLDGYNGHLVLHVDGLLVDGSIQQAQRVERDIVLPPLLWLKPTPAGFFATRVKGQTTRGMLGSCMIVYRRLDNQGYLISPNWRQQHAGIPDVFAKALTLVSLLLERARHRSELTSDASLTVPTWKSSSEHAEALRQSENAVSDPLKPLSDEPLGSQ